MTKCDFTLHSHIIVKIEIDPTSLMGQGGPEYPRLLIPARIDFNPYVRHGQKQATDELLILGLHGELALENQQKIADSVGRPLLYLVQGFPSYTSATIEFPLTAFVLERIEQSRQGDLRFRCDFNLEVATFGSPLVGPNANQGPPRIAEIESLPTTCNIEVPQSVWTKNVLVGLGYGIVQLIELPRVSVSACKALAHSYKALERAHGRFKLGEYDETVALCRTAVEPIREKLKQLKQENGESLGADYAEKVGSSTVTWLTEILGKTYGVANTPVHSPRTGHFSRLDAEMILTIATHVIAFVARSSAGDDGKLRSDCFRAVE